VLAVAADSKARDGSGGQSAPPGRSRVSKIQRARMLHAMAEVAAQAGAQNATVARVVARSGVSRRTFYDLFEDREDCFLAAFEDALGRLAQRVLPAYREDARWPARVRAALLEILLFFEEEPDLGRLLVVESLTAGSRAVARREQLVALLVTAVQEGARATKAGRAGIALGGEGAVGAVLSVVHARLQRSETQSLTALVGPLMGMIVLPYQGQAAARRESERPAPALAPRSPARRGDPLRDLDMRLTYRTVRVLSAIGEHPGASNRAVAALAGIADQGQISKLLLRLQNLGLIENTGEGPTRGEPNAWSLSPRGEEVEQTIGAEAAPPTAAR
jgi:AcrR family transcriptional regulator